MATEAEMVRGIRESWRTETGEDPGNDGAAVLLDRMCEAFYEKYHGAGASYAVAEDPMVAEYLVWKWTGQDRKDLRVAMTARAKALGLI